MPRFPYVSCNSRRHTNQPNSWSFGSLLVVWFPSCLASAAIALCCACFRYGMDALEGMRKGSYTTIILDLGIHCYCNAQPELFLIHTPAPLHILMPTSAPVVSISPDSFRGTEARDSVPGNHASTQLNKI